MSATTQLDLRRDDIAQEKKYGTNAAARRHADRIKSDDDAATHKEAVQEVTEVRKSRITVIDLLGPYRWARVWVILGITLGLATLGWLAAYGSDISDNMVLVGMVAVCAAAALAVFGVTRMREVKRQNDVMPVAISENDVEDSQRFVSLFGPSSGSPSALFAGLAGGLEGGAAAMAISQALVGVPAVLQLGAALGFAILAGYLIARSSDRFGWRVRKIRAWARVRDLEKLDDTKYPEVAEQLEYIERKLRYLTGGVHPAPTRKDWLMLGLWLCVPPVLFATVLAVRLMAPEQHVTSHVLVALTTLACVFGWAGYAAAASAHLLTEVAPLHTIVHRRFPTLVVFREWKRGQFRTLEAWANDHVRRVNAILTAQRERKDARDKSARVRVELPFPALPVASSTTSPPAAEPDLRVVGGN